MYLRLVGHAPVARDAVVTVERHGDADTLWLDARGLTFVGPLDLTGMVALAHMAADADLPVAFLAPEDPNVASYVQRMDLLTGLPPSTRIMGDFAPGLRTELGSQLMEVTPLSTRNVDDVANRLGRIATAHYPGGTGSRVWSAFAELLDNAVSHGCSDRGAFVAAQTYTGTTTPSAGLEVAVCDTGVGILTHLRSNPRHARLVTERAALHAAVRKGVSGTLDARGNGLPDLLRLAEQEGAFEFQLTSGDAHLVITHASTTRRAGRRHLRGVRGTWARLRLEVPRTNADSAMVQSIQ